jgi:hypothetical protein
VLGAEGGVRAESEEFLPRNARVLQEPKFSSESKRVLGLRVDAVLAVLPMASAVVMANVS